MTQFVEEAARGSFKIATVDIMRSTGLNHIAINGVLVIFLIASFQEDRMQGSVLGLGNLRMKVSIIQEMNQSAIGVVDLKMCGGTLV